MTLDELKAIADESVHGLVGCNDPHLAALHESWAPFRRFLYAVAMEIKPEVIVECGVNMGTGTAHMASGSPDTLVIGIDWKYHADVWDVVGPYMNIVLLDGDTVAMAPTVKGLIGGSRIGLLFLDSTHDGLTPISEFMAYRPMFADECIVAVDDLLGPKHQMEQMQEFWRWLPGKKTELHFLHPVPETHIGIIDQPGFGVSIVRKDD